MHEGIARFLAFWFVLCIALTATGTMAIANWAHGGGALFGLAAGWISTQQRPWPWRILLGVATAGLVAAVHFGVVVR